MVEIAGREEQPGDELFLGVARSRNCQTVVATFALKLWQTSQKGLARHDPYR